MFFLAHFDDMFSIFMVTNMGFGEGPKNDELFQGFKAQNALSFEEVFGQKPAFS